MVDWITVTSPIGWVTPLEGSYLTVSDWATAGGYKGHSALWQGGGSVVWASNGKGRSLSQLSGPMAQKHAASMAEWMVSAARGDWQGEIPEPAKVWRCTRLDIKLDVACAEKFDAFALKETLEGAAWGHRPPRLIAWSSDTDTLYIGASGAVKRWRVYQKAPGVVRYELQLRNNSRQRLAQGAVFEWREGDGLGAVWDAEAAKIPLGVIPAGGASGVDYAMIADAEEKHPYHWLNSAVRPYLDKMSPELATRWLLETAEAISEKHS